MSDHSVCLQCCKCTIKTFLSLLGRWFRWAWYFHMTKPLVLAEPACRLYKGALLLLVTLCHLVRNKPLLEQIFTYCRLDSYEQTENWIHIRNLSFKDAFKNVKVMAVVLSCIHLQTCNWLTTWSLPFRAPKTKGQQGQFEIMCLYKRVCLSST